MSVNCTSGVGVAPIRQKRRLHAVIEWRACRGLLMIGPCLVLSEFPGVEYSLRFLENKEVIGGQGLEALLPAGGPVEFHAVRLGGAAQSEVETEVVLRIVA